MANKIPPQNTPWCYWTKPEPMLGGKPRPHTTAIKANKHTLNIYIHVQSWNFVFRECDRTCPGGTVFNLGL